MSGPDRLREDLRLLEERLAALEDRRGTISESVYERVHREYSERRQHALAALESLHVASTELEGEIHDLEEQLRTHSETREELQVRHELGEITDEQYTRTSGQIEAKCREQLLDLMRKYALAGKKPPADIQDLNELLVFDAPDEDEPSLEPPPRARSPFLDDSASSSDLPDDEPMGDSIVDAPNDVQGPATLDDPLPPNPFADTLEDEEPPAHEPPSAPKTIGESVITPTRRVEREPKVPESERKLISQGLNFKDIVKRAQPSEPRQREHPSSTTQRRMGGFAISERKKPQLPSNEEIPVVRVLSPQGRDSFVSLKKEIIRIGRLPDNDIVIQGDHAVSRHHAEIHTNRDRSQIIDLKSANGTLVNGNKTQIAKLACNDIISVGRTTLIFIDDPEELSYYR